jgi:hypothetical protein
MKSIVACTFLLVLGACFAAEFPVEPYVDPTQLEVPWPRHSFYRVPWRAYLETVSGFDLLQGVGVAYNVSGNPDILMRMLSECGFRTMRFEWGWNCQTWDGPGIDPGREQEIRKTLQAARRWNVKACILLNAHHGVPCPVRGWRVKLLADAPKGAAEVKLDNVKDFVPGYTGLSNIEDYWAASVIFTQIDAATGTCKLSKPLPKDLKAGQQVDVHRLRYLPLHPVGTKEFDETAQGWVNYARAICAIAADEGFRDCRIEIWNELSFGSNFTNINHYYKPDKAKMPDFLNKGGSAWELARRTVDMAHREFPAMEVIWGFSNTTFYHCKIENLPPGTDGQTYHPYFESRRLKLPENDYRNWSLEQPLPSFTWHLPEAAANFPQTEAIIRLINPKARLARPEGTRVFRHYITEYGMPIQDYGVKDVDRAWHIKNKMISRGTLFFLSKGLCGLYHFCAGGDALDMGLLGKQAEKLTEYPADLDAALSPSLKMMKRLTSAFDGSVPLASMRQLGAEVAALDQRVQLPAGPDNKWPPLYQHQRFCVLPYQVKPDRFVVALYVQSIDILEDIEPQPYRVALTNIRGADAKLEMIDVLSGKPVPFKTLEATDERLRIEFDAVGWPYLLMVQEKTPR